MNWFSLTIEDFLYIVNNDDECHTYFLVTISLSYHGTVIKTISIKVIYHINLVFISQRILTDVHKILNYIYRIGPYLLTTSIECRDISMLTRTLKYSVMCWEWISFSRTDIATIGLFSTRSGNWNVYSLYYGDSLYKN